MFDDLDASLPAMLDGPGRPGGRARRRRQLRTPDKDFRPQQPTLNLFLHEVQENRALRDDAPVHPADRRRRTPATRRRCGSTAPTWSPRGRRRPRGLQAAGGAPAAGPRAAVAGPLSRSSTTRTCAGRSRRRRSPTRWPRPCRPDPGGPVDGRVLDRARHRPAARVLAHRDDRPAAVRPSRTLPRR